MENKIKEHIDKLLKMRLRESVNFELDKFKNESGKCLDRRTEDRKKTQIQNS